MEQRRTRQREAARPARGTPFASQHVLITGATGTLGRLLALRLARPGMRLSLWARNRERLAELAEACRAAGAEATTRSLDLADSAVALAALAREEDRGPLDLVLLVAGQGDTAAAGAAVEDAAQVARLAIVNYATPAALAAAAGARMAARGRGRIVLVGTAAAFHSLPFAPGYAGSKAGLHRFADALRLALRPHGVTVTLAAPGFFAAPGTLRTRPFEIPAELVAERILTAAAQGQARLVTPWPFAALRWLDRALPRALRDRLLSALPRP